MRYLEAVDPELMRDADVPDWSILRPISLWGAAHLELARRNQAHFRGVSIGSRRVRSIAAAAEARIRRGRFDAAHRCPRRWGLPARGPCQKQEGARSHHP